MGSLEDFELEYEDMKPNKKKVSRAAMANIAKEARQAAKAKKRSEKVPKALNVDIRTYSNFKKLGVSVEFCSIKGVRALIVTLVFIEVLIRFKKVAR